MKNSANGQRFQKYVYVKRRIRKAQSKAKTVGIAYLLATLVVLAVFFLREQLGIVASTVKVPIVIEYAVYVVAALCILLSLRRLRWLLANKASRLYGFNRNVYAMDDMGKYFSFTLATVLTALFACAFRYQDFRLQQTGLIVIAVLLVLHFVLGIAGGTVSVFDTTDGIIEQRREAGMISVILRNVVQLEVANRLIYTLVSDRTVYASVRSFLKSLSTIMENNTLFSDMNALLCSVGYILLGAAVVCMLFYAVGTKEYDMEGAKTPGRKRFLLWTFFALLGSVCVFLGTGQNSTTAITCLVITVVALLFELITINRPHKKTSGKKKGAANQDMDVNAYIRENIGNMPSPVFAYYLANVVSGNAAPNTAATPKSDIDEFTEDEWDD